MTRKVKITKPGRANVHDRSCPECGGNSAKIINYKWNFSLPETEFWCLKCGCEWLEDDYERMNQYLDGDKWIEIDDTERG